MQAFKDLAKKAFGEHGAPQTKVIGTCKECEKPIVEVSGVYPNFLPKDMAGKAFKKTKCGCEEKELAKKTVQTHRRMLKRKILHIFEQHSIINEQLKDSTLEAYEAETESQQKALKATQIFVDNVLDKDKKAQNVLLSGSYGVGKSHLGAAACHELTKRGKTAIFITVPKLLTKFKSTYGKQQSDFNEDQLLRMLETVDALILDDIGANKDTDWTDEKLFQIIDARQGKATFYTTNLNSEQLAENIGHRNMERLKDNTMPLKVEGRSRRKHITESEWNF